MANGDYYGIVNYAERLRATYAHAPVVTSPDLLAQLFQDNFFRFDMNTALESRKAVTKELQAIVQLNSGRQLLMLLHQKLQSNGSFINFQPSPIYNCYCVEDKTLSFSWQQRIFTNRFPSNTFKEEGPKCILFHELLHALWNEEKKSWAAESLPPTLDENFVSLEEQVTITGYDPNQNELSVCENAFLQELGEEFRQNHRVFKVSADEFSNTHLEESVKQSVFSKCPEMIDAYLSYFPHGLENSCLTMAVETEGCIVEDLMHLIGLGVRVDRKDSSQGGPIVTAMTYQKPHLARFLLMVGYARHGGLNRAFLLRNNKGCLPEEEIQELGTGGPEIFARIRSLLEQRSLEVNSVYRTLPRLVRRAIAGMEDMVKGEEGFQEAITYLDKVLGRERCIPLPEEERNASFQKNPILQQRSEW